LSQAAQAQTSRSYGQAQGARGSHGHAMGGSITAQCQGDREFFPKCDPTCARGKGPCWLDDAPDEDMTDGEGDVQDSQAMINHKLLKAARDGDVAGIRKALGRGAYLETRRPFIMKPESTSQDGPASPVRGVGLTPLMYAAHGGYLQACELLIGANACIHAEDEDGLQPIHFGASSGSTETVILLMQNGAQADAADDEGLIPMDHVPLQYLKSPAQRRQWREAFEQTVCRAALLEECPDDVSETKKPGRKRAR